MAKLKNDQPPSNKINEETDNGVTKFIKDYSKDLNLLQNQLALFHPESNKFFKLGVLDFRGQRFEVWGESIGRLFSFNEVILFNYFNEEEFNKYYELYKTSEGRIKSKDKILQWFSNYEGRISHMDGYAELLASRAERKKDQFNTEK